MSRRMAAFSAVTWDLIVHGPGGGPATARHDTYRWLTSFPAGRAALCSVWLGLHLAGCGYLTLLALWVRRAEFAEVTR